MPVSLDAPITATVQTSLSLSDLKITKHQIMNEEKVAKVWLDDVSDPANPRALGSVAIENLDDQRVIDLAGHQITVLAGTHFDDMVANDYAGADIYARVKAALYDALGTVLGLTGTVT